MKILVNRLIYISRFNFCIIFTCISRFYPEICNPKILSLKKLSILIISLFCMETSMSQVVISSTKEIHLCDEDADGVVSVPFSHLQSYALDILAEFNEQPEIYLTQAYSGIIRIRNIYDANPQIQTLCQNNDGNGGFYDIAINSAKEIYIVRQGGLVQKVNMENQLCQYTNVGS